MMASLVFAPGSQPITLKSFCFTVSTALWIRTRAFVRAREASACGFSESRAVCKTLKDLQTALDSENPHAEASLALTNARVRIQSAVETVKQKDFNVIGWLPGANTNDAIMIGAH